MTRVKLILVLVGIACFVASASYAEEIEINEAYTTKYTNYVDGSMTPVTEFQVGAPVMYVIDYKITGDSNKKYKVIITVKSSGDRIKFTERHRAGDDIVSVTTNLVQSDDIGPQTVKYVVKLKEKGVPGVLDQDSTTSQITVE